MKIYYAHKMIEAENEKVNIVLKSFDDNEICNEIKNIIQLSKYFKNPNIFGDKKLGKPIEYEKLIIEENNEKKEYEYFNKGIHFMMSSDEELRKVFQVFTHFMIKK